MINTLIKSKTSTILAIINHKILFRRREITKAMNMIQAKTKALNTCQHNQTSQENQT